MAHIALVHDHVGGKAGGGGGVRLMLELGTSLLDLGHTVTVVCHDFQPGAEFDAAGSLDVRAVQTGAAGLLSSRRKFMERYLVGMRAVAKLVPAGVDVVNAHESPGLRGGRLAARRLGVPLVWTRNDETIWERAAVPDRAIVADPSLPGRSLRALAGIPELRDARAADEIVVLGTGQVEMVERSYRRAATVIPMGPPRHFFDHPERAAARARLGVSNDTFLCVGAGILYPHRRFEDLIEALALVDDPEVHALIVGSDHGDVAYGDRLAALIARRGLGDRVRLPRANVSDADLKDAYSAADLFVFPNQRQTWGLAPMEAIACGTPAVVSSGAGVHEVLGGRPGVLTVPPETPPRIADAIRRARTGGLREGLEDTREWLRTQLSSEGYARQMAAVFERVLETPR